VTVRRAKALTVEDVVLRETEALAGLEDLPDWIERHLREDAETSWSLPTTEEDS
jgi:hypothetical protein